jgi:hypothetical protein
VLRDKRDLRPRIEQKIIREHGNLTLPFERACVFMSETMFTICGFFQYGGLIIAIYNRVWEVTFCSAKFNLKHDAQQSVS